MTSKLRRCAVHLVAAAVAAGLPAAAAVVPPGTVLAAKQELVRNNGAEPESLDPQLIESTNAFNILIDLFEGLTALDNHAKVVPGVAESWKQVEPTTWVFKLRKDARWSNGEPVTAPDFVYGWHRLVDPKNAAPLGSTMGAYVLNGVAITQGKMPVTALGVRALDAGTLEVRTPGPLPFLPYLLANVQFSPVPHAVVEKYGRDWTRPGNLVGNGAFVLKEWQVNSKVVVEKSATYWDASHVVLARSTYLPVEDNNADLKLYQSGEDDMTNRTPPGAYEALKAQYPKEMHNGTQLSIRFWALNNTDPLLRDVRVRKALSMVIDRELMAAKVTADGQLPIYGLVLKGSEGVDPVRYEWADWPMDRRVAEARRLLAEAGIKPGTRLKYAYNTSDYHKRLALFTAAEWKAKLGLETELEAMEYKVLIHRRESAQYQVARHAWTPGYADITGLLALVECGNDANDNKSCSRAGDDLMHQAAALSDPVKRKALLTQAVRVEMEDYPMIPLLQMSLPRLVKPWVGGYDDANDQDAFRSKDFYILRH
jgi:oligopeptide transport system substrate-binding protein